MTPQSTPERAVSSPVRLDAPAESLRHERDVISDVVAKKQVRAEIAEGMAAWASRIDAELARRDAA